MNKLSLPNELTNDGYFCAYTLRYFINEYVITHNMTSKDDLQVKYEENMNLMLLMINRAINHGCYHFKYNKDENIFLKACKELYLEIIKHQKKWNPENVDCEYFKVQNQIALGEKKKSFSYTEDPNIDKELYNKMRGRYSTVENTINTVKRDMHLTLKRQGFTEDQIDQLIDVSINNPNMTESKLKEFKEYNSKIAKINNTSEYFEEKVDVDSFLKELGLL